jgi:hypothetical protein
MLCILVECYGDVWAARLDCFPSSPDFGEGTSDRGSVRCAYDKHTCASSAMIADVMYVEI